MLSKGFDFITKYFVYKYIVIDLVTLHSLKKSFLKNHLIDCCYTSFILLFNNGRFIKISELLNKNLVANRIVKRIFIFLLLSMKIGLKRLLSVEVVLVSGS